jgi:5-methylcytosine-specific restriction endonuclease McrA
MPSPYINMPIACATCGKPIFNASRCPEHRTAWKRRPTRNQGAYRGAWPLLVKQILERDPQCILRYPGCEGRSVEVDHVIGVSEGGDNSPENVRGVCRRCHATRTGQQGARANARRRKEGGSNVTPIR